MVAARPHLLPDASVRTLAGGFLGLVGLTTALIVLGALVRAHEAGLSCPDWPLCFGQLVPRFDLRVAFEWSHRLVAGSVSLFFVTLGALTLRSPEGRRAAGRLLALAAGLLALQVLLGALTVWHLLAQWTVTSHLLTGNAFNACLLCTALALRERAAPPGPSAVPQGARAAVTVAAVLLALQMTLGGLVSSGYAGLACPEWPACNGGVWFPSLSGSVGLHLLHRTNGYALLLALLAAAWTSRGVRRLGPLAATAAGLGALQVGVGVANVLLGLPVEVTGLHSALAAALVLTITAAAREAWRHGGAKAVA